MNSIARHPQGEPLPAPPRGVRRRRGLNPALKAVLFLLIPHVWVGVGMMGVVIGSIALSVVGQRHNAKVLDRQISRAKGTRYQITYAYEESGAHFEDRATISKDDYDHLSPGDAVPIRSLHVGRLGSSRLADGRDRGGSPICCMGAFAIIWNGILLGMFYGMVIAPLRQAKLVRLGQAVPGRIVSRKEQKGKGTTYTLYYAYATLEGYERTASMTVRKEDYDSHHEGDEVTVLCAPGGRFGGSLIYDCADYVAIDPYGYPVGV
jgi:hypothetical protein